MRRALIVLLSIVAVLAPAAPSADATERVLIIRTTGPSRVTVRFKTAVTLTPSMTNASVASDGVSGYVFLPTTESGPVAGWISWFGNRSGWEDTVVGDWRVRLPAGTYTLLTTSHPDGSRFELPYTGGPDRVIYATTPVQQALSTAVWDQPLGTKLHGEAVAPVRSTAAFVLAVVEYDMASAGDDRVLVCLDQPMPTAKGCPGQLRSRAQRPHGLGQSVIGPIERAAIFTRPRARNYSAHFDVTATGLLASPHGWVYTLG